MKFIIKPDNDILRNVIASLGQLDPYKSYSVTVSENIPTKTAQQRSYFHSILGIIEKEHGISKDDLKTRFCFTRGYTKYVKLKDGREIEQRKSTEDLTKEEYSVLIDMAQETCDILELTYPLPRYFGHDY